MPDGHVYDLDGVEIGRARVVVRHDPSGHISGAVCFYDEDIALRSATVMIDVPTEMPAPPEGDEPSFREMTEAEVLTSRQPVRFRIVGGAPPLFLIETA